MKYTGWKVDVRDVTVGDRKINVAFFTDDQGNDWYQLVDKIDRLGKYIVGVNDNGSICWIDTTARAKYSPPIGGFIVLLDEIPEDYTNKELWEYKDNKIVKVEDNQVTTRTKEEIMADLMQLKKELDALK